VDAGAAGHHSSVTYTAIAALRHVDAVSAVSELRGELRELAGVDRTVPDWATLRVVGPDEVVGDRGQVWYEWTAAVDAPRRRRSA
jgi:hypothetical protein